MRSRLQQREIEVQIDDGLPADPARDGEVLRIAQEALQNALGHADADLVAVRLSREEHILVLEVSDDVISAITVHQKQQDDWDEFFS